MFFGIWVCIARICGKKRFQIKREVGLRLNLVVGRKAVVEEVTEVVGGGGRYGGLVWR